MLADTACNMPTASVVPSILAKNAAKPSIGNKVTSPIAYGVPYGVESVGSMSAARGRRRSRTPGP